MMDPVRLRRLGLDLAAGATLGALSFLAVRTLGLHTVTAWDRFQFFWVFVAAGALLYATRLRSFIWAIVGSLVVIIAIVGYTPVIVRPARALIRNDSLRSVDAVVALASGVNDDALLDPVGLDRLLTAISLAGDERVRGNAAHLPLIVTPVVQRHSPHRSSEADQRRIVAAAGPHLDVYFTDRVLTTRDEARKVAALARAEEWDTVAVVTSPSHTRRACATFERVNLSVVCVPALARDLAMYSLRDPADRLRAFQHWFYESIGAAYYKVRGWL